MCNHHEPLISCIIATYNAEKTIEQAIKSVVSQTYKMQLIVIDGGSTDRTLQILSKYDEMIDVLISEPDNGIYDAFNKGIRHANGKYAYFLGTDDCLVSPDIVSEVVKKFKEKEPDALYGPVYVVDEIKHWEYRSFTEANEENFYRDIHCAHQGMFVKTELLREHPFDTSFAICGDHEFVCWLYFCKKAAFEKVDSAIAYYSNGGSSRVTNPKLKEESLRIMKQYRYPISVINRFKSGEETLTIRIKRHIRELFEMFGILKYWRMHQGWRKHHCVWDNCRWE